ncbi:TPA: hypothetical protein NHH79_001103 [Legionella pneumophila]|nr:hypothetical protein [Legionella pneumophila]HAT3883663.1 hypothetical protein [Legionella pneumophila]HAU0970502.1 hypothetical protein [Legionella pneumophila]HAU1067848.1 hypothetical protein [Legionella pneumophila]HAU1225610.1 hypothetical protein [Legionella pneumophila]
MTKKHYDYNVFINCPFDDEYLTLRKALVFAIFDCGFIPRCALEEDNGANVRVGKIMQLIKESKFGLHDISRTELDINTNLPRFNMPLELGVFLGAMNFGVDEQKEKNCLILDCEPYRYQAFISDIAGHDIRSHNSDPEELIKLVRNWLNDASTDKIIPGGREIVRRFRAFEEDLPTICAAVPIDIDELTFNDYAQLISEWLRKNT